MNSMSWNGNQFYQHLVEQLDARLGEAAEVLATRMRNNLSEDYPPASMPGQSPHRRTGNLQASVEVKKPQPLKRLVGSSAAYAKFLEFGTSKMAARPWALKSLMQAKNDLNQVILGKQDFRLGVEPFAASFAHGFEPK